MPASCPNHFHVCVGIASVSVSDVLLFCLAKKVWNILSIDKASEARGLMLLCCAGAM